MWRYRSEVLLRTVVALGGGYALSAAWAAVCGLVVVRWFSMSRVDAVMWFTTLSFVVYAVVVLWAFACGSTRKVCRVIGVSTALLVAAAWLLSGGQA
ncbi:MAG: iron transporter [Comamonas sp.]